MKTAHTKAIYPSLGRDHRGDLPKNEGAYPLRAPTSCSCPPRSRVTPSGATGSPCSQSDPARPTYVLRAQTDEGSLSEP